MSSLTLTLLPTAVSRFHEALSCLAKFDESVYLEAFPTYLSLSTLNTSKTAYACFKFDAANFFENYKYGSASRATSQSDGLNGCLFLNKALSSIFKRRIAETREKQSALEHCEVQLFSGSDEAESRLLIRMFCRNSVVYTYRLTYEAVEVMHAKYDSNKTQNHWSIDSKVVRDVVEYFGPKTEQLDWYYAKDKVTFTSYTEKVQHGREILKQPMHTSVTLEPNDFNSFEVQEGLHTVIMVKDFRAIVALAEALHTSISSNYSRGNRPLQFAFDVEGMTCEFTLMTRGHSDIQDNTSTTGTPARDLAVRPSSRAPQITRPSSRMQADSSMAPPPAKKHTLKAAAPSRTTEPPSTNDSGIRPVLSASLDPDSLFLPADDDQAWDEPDYTAEEDDVGWDASLNRDSFASDPARRLQDGGFTQNAGTRQLLDHPGIAPTQRLSDVQGLFD